jgi:serine/threonine-protein kinase
MQGDLPATAESPSESTPEGSAWHSIDVLSTLRRGLTPHYTVEREIGAGGMAKVFLAAERHPPRKVAIKVLSPELSTPVFRGRFVREVELASQLNHPNIIPILAADECLFVPDEPDGLCYYVMPYIEGASLRDRIAKDHTLPLREALEIARQIADALSYAHAQGIVHRDIKPENILLAEGRALVADFGIARAVSAAGGKTLTLVGHAIGTPGYMSPEQRAGVPNIDARTDIYSLACVFYEMVVGRPPLFDALGEKIGSALRAQGVGGWAARRFARVLARALAADPGQRFAHVGEFAAALKQAARRRTVESWVPLLDRRAAVAAAVTLIATTVVVLARRPALDPGRAVVAGFEDLSGNPGLAYLAHLSAHWVTDAIAKSGVVEVVPATTTAHVDADGVRGLASANGAGTVVLGSYHTDGDSVRIQVQIVDAKRGVLRRMLPPVVAPVGAPHLAAEPLRHSVLAVFDTLFGSGAPAPSPSAARRR